MRLIIIASLILIGITVGYGLLRSEAALFGPEIIIEYPSAYEHIPQIFTVRGQVKGATFLTLNDRRIYPNRDGIFEEDLVLPTGYTIVEIYARNRQSRETIIHLPLYIQPHDNKEEHGETQRDEEIININLDSDGE